MDFILANPPFNYHPWNQKKLLEDVRWKYGIPPAGNANYAWIQHMIIELQVNVPAADRLLRKAVETKLAFSDSNLVEFACIDDKDLATAAVRNSVD